MLTFLNANKENLDDIRETIGIKLEDYPLQKNISDYMEDNKTDWALKVFNSTKQFCYPDYITEAIDWVHEGE